MSVPKKYREMGDFHKYYSGAKEAPYLTVFAGGNHESSCYLQELYYGGWVAPKIYYLGAANVIRFGTLRIASMSGIWKGYNYKKPHFERLPYTADEVKSLYHVREMEVRKLLLVKNPIDVGISHDWPREIEWSGDHRKLFRQKDHLEPDARAGTLGSPAAKYVMDRLRPRYWFAAHLHCKFTALKVYGYDQQSGDRTQQTIAAYNNVHTSQDHLDFGGNKANVQPAKNQDEIDLDLEDDDVNAERSPPMEEPQAKPPERNEERSDETKEKAETKDPQEAQESFQATPDDVRSQLPASFFKNKDLSQTSGKPFAPPPMIHNDRVRFLALDKPLPNRDFLQLTEIACEDAGEHSDSEPKLSYDQEWLAILRVFAQNDPHVNFPLDEGEGHYSALTEAEERWVAKNLTSQDKMKVPENFVLTGPPYDGNDIHSIGNEQPVEYSNPQTMTFCELLEIPNWFNDSEQVRATRRRSKYLEIAGASNPNADHHVHGRPHHGRRGGGHRGFRGGRARGRGRGR